MQKKEATLCIFYLQNTHANQLDQLRSIVGNNDEKYSSGMSQGLQSFESNIIAPNVTYDGCYNVGKKIGDVISFELGVAETVWGVVKTGASAVVRVGGYAAKIKGREAIAVPAMEFSAELLASGVLSFHGGKNVMSASWDNLTSGSKGTSKDNNWGNQDTLTDHYDRPGGDFDATSEQDYASQANDFYNNRRNYDVKVDSNGTIRVYDSNTNTFGSYNSNGTTKTFYKPDKGIDYWNGQPGN
ncbi:hypothetical protein JYG23_04345 [Sedimentibacter sp. zth1]|uniref:hypothetical protein n=1 Tax=Sedimentibacter sp. zth1 TaxID=2816908 RepID=UPI001A90CF86|nr:hypothetical protein [Sedimentibacter sp. zth1]QSX06691.1 hypothetical protein JYG23_04345 [Sedimentibacter sp. zth1]